MFRWFALFPLLLLTAARPGWAADVRYIDVSEKDDRYVVSFDAVINAPVDKALRIMLTPALWPKLSSVIVETKVLEGTQGNPRKVSMTLRDCILFFCKTIYKTEEITIKADGYVESLAIPEQSDFSYAREDWHIFAENGMTRIRYNSEMVPSFFVPPLIGPYILKSRIRSQLLQTINRLEIMSRS